MARLSLNPNPTFKLKVEIPVAGGEVAEVEFTFKHLGVKQLGEWSESNRDKLSAEAITEIALGWDLDDAFTVENVERLLDGYGGADVAIFKAYLFELRGVRAKN